MSQTPHPQSFDAQPHRLQVLSPREASMFASVADAIVAPEPTFPPVRETTAVYFFDDWLARSAPINRLAIRSLVWIAEFLPLLMGFHARLRRLAPGDRDRFVASTARTKNFAVQTAIKILKTMVMFSYYGADNVFGTTGYDAEMLLARGRELRAAEGRP